MTRAQAWLPIAAGLTVRAAACDFAGHGGSDASEVEDVQGEAMEDALALADHWAGEDPIWLVGHSFGATVALRLALARPERVAGLLLFEPVYFVLAHDAGDPAYLAYMTDWHPIGEACAAGAWQQAAALFIARWGGAPWDTLSDRQRARRAVQMQLVYKSGAQLAMPEMPGRLRLSDLSALACPLHIVRGGETNAVIPAIHRAILSAVPQARETVVSGSGHMVPLTHPEVASKLIAQTLAVV